VARLRPHHDFAEDRLSARLAAALALAAVTWLSCRSALAKDYGIHSPSGRVIYDADERFEDVTNTRLRRFVVEAAVGAGPEGNIAALVGLLNWPVRRLEYYAGFGLELNPARNYTFAVRYAFNIHGYRPYVGLGYLFKDVYEVGTYSHNAFVEAGYSWVLHQTYRVTAGLGLRYIASIGIKDDSPLRGAHIDQALLADETDRVFPLTPTLALRFSRAF
jgi:hypothetical protein